MTPEFAKRLVPWLVLALLVSWVALAYTISTSEEPRQVTEIPTAGHVMQFAFDLNDELKFYDKDGNPIVPVEVDPANPMGATLKRENIVISSGVPATFLSFKFNPNCNGTVWHGARCSAPHAYCCQ